MLYTTNMRRRRFDPYYNSFPPPRPTIIDTSQSSPAPPPPPDDDGLPIIPIIIGIIVIVAIIIGIYIYSKSNKSSTSSSSTTSTATSKSQTVSTTSSSFATGGTAAQLSGGGGGTAAQLSGGGGAFSSYKVYQKFKNKDNGRYLYVRSDNTLGLTSTEAEADTFNITNGSMKSSKTGLYVKDPNNTNYNPQMTNTGYATDITWDGTYIKVGTKCFVYEINGLRINTCTTNDQSRWSTITP